MASRVGFEPTIPCGISVFETDTFDHSDTSTYLYTILNYRYFQANYYYNKYKKIEIIKIKFSFISTFIYIFFIKNKRIIINDFNLFFHSS